MTIHFYLEPYTNNLSIEARTQAGKPVSIASLQKTATDDPVLQRAYHLLAAAASRREENPQATARIDGLETHTDFQLLNALRALSQEDPQATNATFEHKPLQATIDLDTKETLALHAPIHGTNQPLNQTTLFGYEQLWGYTKNLHLFELDLRHAGVLTQLSKRCREPIPATFTKTFLEQNYHNEGKLGRVQIDQANTIQTQQYTPTPRIYLSENGDELQMQLRFAYGQQEIPAHDNKELYHYSSGQITRTPRDKKTEDFYKLQFKTNNVRATRDGYTPRNDAYEWLADDVQELLALGYEIYGKNNLVHHRITTEAKLRVETKEENNNWLELDVQATIGEEELPLDVLTELLRKGERYVKLADQTTGVIPQKWLDKLSHTIGLLQLRADGVSIQHTQLRAADALLELADEKLTSPDYEKLKKRLAGFEELQEYEMPSEFNGELRAYQKVGYDWLQFLREYSFGGILADDMGLGKAQSVDSLVLTPTGWRRLGDIQAGDKIMNAKGNISSVKGVFPQGKKELFEIIFTDGSTTTCCDEHLWAVKTPVQKYREQGFKVREFRDFKDDLIDKHGNTKYFVPLTKPLQFPSQEVFVDPYLLGLLLGDGGLTNRIIFSTSDEQLVQEIKRRVPDDVQVKKLSWSKYDYGIIGEKWVKNSLRKALDDMGVHGKRSENKFIPKLYLFNDIQTRTAILQGLLDTDGYVDQSGYVTQFTSTSKQLIKDVHFLVQSLGGLALLSQKKPKGGRMAYTLTLQLAPEIQPFKLDRKRKCYKAKTKYPPARGFREYKSIGNKEAICIQTDAPDHLYITDDFIVTHNTVQMLAALAKYHEEHPSAQSLVVVPTSLVHNWDAERAKFTPQLTSHVQHGNRPQTAEEYAKIDAQLVITTYNTLRNDIELLSNKRFGYAILDESHAIKNPTSQVSKAVTRINASNKIAVTGTPIENSLDELWSQMNFANPGMLGGYDYFNKTYTDEEKHDELRALIKPFILQRTKEAVAKDLPPKQISVQYHEMSGEQARLYQATRAYYRDDVLEAMDAGDERKSQTAVFTGLLRLRQLSNHPGLISESYAGSSTKLDSLCEQLHELASEGHKALIFSSFVGLLDELEKRLSELRVLRLDGSTNNRQDLVDEFQEGETDVFLISLKAGGVGLTLTAADYVYILDPWWNPQAEMQAIDRAHRIGQDKPVFVYKMITKNTVEEKILAMQESKLELANNIIESESGIYKTLTKADIEYLFE